MKGHELYAMWAKHMSAEEAIVVPWAGMTEAGRRAWGRLASDVNAEIEDAVVEVLPGVEAGQRTDV